MSIFIDFITNMQQEIIENPIRKKIKEKSVLKKSSLSKTTLFRLQTSILNTIQSSSSASNAHLAEEVLRGIQVNSHLTDYLTTLDQEIAQITQELAQLERAYHFAENLENQQEVESFDFPSMQEKEHKTGLLLSRLNQVLSVSRSLGSRELLRMACPDPNYTLEQLTPGQRPPPLVFTHDR
jgi:TolA-binding protein